MPATETFYDVAMQRLNEQMDRVDKLDSKLAAIFSFSAAILPIFGALLALFGKGRPKASIGLYIVAFVFLLLFSAFAYRAREWSLRPDPEVLQERSAIYDEAAVRFWVAAECVRSITENRSLLNRKANHVSVAIVLLALDAVLLSVAAVLLLAQRV